MSPLFSFVLMVTAAAGLIAALIPFKFSLRSAPLFLVGAMGLSFGLSSLLYCLWHRVFFNLSYAFFSSVIGLIFLALFTWHRRSKKEYFTLPSGEPITILAGLLGGIFLSLYAKGLLTGLSNASHSPHGDWDAWAIWNLRARFLFRAGQEWQAAFSPLLSWSHPDYPLLLPTTILHYWSYVGRELLSVPMGVGLLFSALLPLLLVSALTRLRSWSQGLLAGIFLLCLLPIIEEGSRQYADVPLSFYMLGTFVSLSLADKTSALHKPSLYTLAGLSASLAAWTKNEGVVVLIGTALVLTFATRSVRYVGAFAKGALPFGTLLLLFKLGVAPQNDLTGAVLSTPPSFISSTHKFVLILQYAWERCHKTIWWLSALLSLYGITYASLGLEAFERRPAGKYFAIIGIVCAGYAAAYLVTPYDLSWHLQTSFDRLLIQVIPSIIFCVFLVSPSPEVVIRALIPLTNSGEKSCTVEKLGRLR